MLVTDKGHHLPTVMIVTGPEALIPPHCCPPSLTADLMHLWPSTSSGGLDGPLTPAGARRTRPPLQPACSLPVSGIGMLRTHLPPSSCLIQPPPPLPFPSSHLSGSQLLPGPLQCTFSTMARGLWSGTLGSGLPLPTVLQWLPPHPAQKPCCLRDTVSDPPPTTQVLGLAVLSAWSVPTPDTYRPPDCAILSPSPALLSLLSSLRPAPTAPAIS